VPLATGPGGLPNDLGLEALHRSGLAHVQRQAFRLALDDVREHDSLEDVVLSQPLRGRRTVEACSDDGDLLAHGSHHNVSTHDQRSRGYVIDTTSGKLWSKGPFEATSSRKLCRSSGTGGAQRRQARRAGLRAVEAEAPRVAELVAHVLLG